MKLEVAQSVNNQFVEAKFQGVKGTPSGAVLAFFKSDKLQDAMTMPLRNPVDLKEVNAIRAAFGLPGFSEVTHIDLPDYQDWDALKKGGYTKTIEVKCTETIKNGRTFINAEQPRAMAGDKIAAEAFGGNAAGDDEELPF